MTYPYFNFNTEEEEKKSFPSESLWEQCCQNCCSWSISDYNAATLRYYEIIKNYLNELEIERYINFIEMQEEELFV